MSSETMYRTCYGDGAAPSITETAVATFEANVQTNTVVTPKETKQAIIQALAEEVVDVLAENNCSRRRLGSRNLELATVFVTSFRDLGSCLSTNEESQSCSTYRGAVTLTYTPNSSKNQVINSALITIKASMDSKRTVDNVNESFEDTDFVVTQVTYAGPDISAFVPSPDSEVVIVGSQKQSFAADDSLNPLGIGMVTFVGVLTAVIAVVLYCICRDRRNRRENRNPVVIGGETKRSFNTDEEGSDSSIPFDNDKANRTSDRLTSSKTKLFDVDSDGIDGFQGSDKLLSSELKLDGSDATKETRDTFSSSDTSLSPTMKLLDTKEKSTKKTKSRRRFKKTKKPISAHLVADLEHEEEDEEAQLHMKTVEEIIAASYRNPPFVQLFATSESVADIVKLVVPNSKDEAPVQAYI